MDGPINPLITISNKLKETFVKPKNIKMMLVDPKNKSLGWFDLGNHILLIGLVLLIYLITINVE